MTLKDLVIQEIDQQRKNADTTSYEDNYDGFTHNEYAGLIEDVLDELAHEGYSTWAPKKVISNIVYELI